MIKYSDILQRSNVFKRISADIKSNTLGHCYLIVSADKVAVDDLFDLIACAVYCKKGVCLHCEECERVINGNHVDVKHTYPQAGKNILVKDIEEIIDDVYKIAYDGQEKLYFIHNAERMNAESQNKLLKILEEPPAKVHFFMATSIEGAILNTVKSRSRQLYVDNFSAKDIENALSSVYTTSEKDQISLASACSDGSLERAEQLLDDEDFFRHYSDVVEMYTKVNKSADVIRYSKSFLFTKDEIRETLNISDLVFRGIMLGDKDDQGVFASEINALSKSFTPIAVANIIDEINDARKRFEANCAPNAIGENLLYTILEVKFKCRKL